jgi:plastocyanin
VRVRAGLGAFVLIVAVGIAIAACGSTPGASAQGPVATTHVDLPKSYKFAPVAIVVTTGATVTWTNSDNFTHSVKFDGDASPGAVMKPGASTTRTFATPGTYPYVCAFHPQDMKGTVVVTAPGSENP